MWILYYSAHMICDTLMQSVCINPANQHKVCNHMKNKSIVITMAAVLMLSGCATDEYGNRRPLTDSEKGAIIGSVTGALIGLTTKKDDRKRNTILLAAGGAIAGGLVGKYMDDQKKDFEKALQQEQQSGSVRIEKLPQNNLLVSMTSATAFEVDSTNIKPGFYSSMDKIANIINRYGKTELLIVGHTDSTGSDAYNLKLSEQRAQAVQNYLMNRNVIPQRMSAYGKGESQPVASNATETGRRQNRRVDIIIIPLVEGQS